MKQVIKSYNKLALNLNNGVFRNTIVSDMTIIALQVYKVT